MLSCCMVHSVYASCSLAAWCTVYVSHVILLPGTQCMCGMFSCCLVQSACESCYLVVWYTVYVHHVLVLSNKGDGE